jgi:cytolysin (calcineurin-like family phosphatase)
MKNFLNKFILSMSLILLANTALGKGQNPPPEPPGMGCVVGFENSNFKGNVFNFCPDKPQPNFKTWNDKISSVRVPKGLKVTFCKDVTQNSLGQAVGVGPCVFYFSDVPYVGDFRNDSFSYYKIGKFNENNFSMIFSSDPQLPWECTAPECKGLSEKDQGALSNTWQVNSIKKTAEALTFEKFAGLIINGDLTAYGHPWQIDMYTKYYESLLPLHVWPGLGNHDYGRNNVNNCWNNRCAAGMLYYLKSRVQSLNIKNFDLNEGGAYYQFPIIKKNYTGSFAYSFNIGKYHFIQFNNYPTWETSFYTWNFKNARRDYFTIIKANEWVKKDLAQNKDKVIILNMHNVGGGDGFYPNEKVEFYKLFAGYNVAAVFGGHFHEYYHFIQNENVGGKAVPVFLSGSSQASTYLVVNFFEDRLEVNTIKSVNGDNPRIKGPYVVPVSSSSPGVPTPLR